jgi:choline dehydrogenase
MLGSIHRRFFLKLFGAAAVTAVGSTTTAGCSTGQGADDGSEDHLEEGAEFDYIVVGSGAGGGPIAANLAKQDGLRVLLLEAGSDHGDRLTYQVPGFHTQSTEDPNMAWDFFVKHYTDEARAAKDPKFQDFSKEEGAHRKGVLYPRAGTLGGCTAHNAMITVYPHASDWDHIAELTNDPTWSAANMRKYFQLVEKCEYLGGRPKEDQAGHGFGGWLNTNMADPSSLLTTLDIRLASMIKAAAVVFGTGDTSAFSQMSGVINDPIALKDTVTKIFNELIGVLTRDVNNVKPERDQTEGLFGLPLAMANGKRTGTREYLVKTRDARPKNLFIETEALVSRVLFASEKVGGKLKATGVEFMKGAKLYRADRQPVKDPQTARRITVKATREVILSAGVYNTPQLLMLSGIGPKKQIGAEGETISVAGDARDKGVKVLKNLEGVGTNLQDRYEVGVVTTTGKDFRLIEECTFGVSTKTTQPTIQTRKGPFGIPIPVPVLAEVTKEDPCLTEWRNGNGKARYSSNGGVVIMIKKSTVAEKDPDLFIFCLPGSFKGYYRGYSQELFHETDGTDNKKRYTWACLKGHTRNNAGDVTLRSGNPWDVPDINFRYFDEGTPDGGKDLQAMVEGVNLIRKINDEAAPVLDLFGDAVEETPGRNVDAQTFVKDNAWGHHASCTCPIGDEDKGGVIDSNFVVHGTSNLRVVDACVFPRIPGFFIVSSIYTISEKATDDVLEAAGRSRRIPRPRTA